MQCGKRLVWSQFCQSLRHGSKGPLKILSVKSGASDGVLSQKLDKLRSFFAEPQEKKSRELLGWSREKYGEFFRWISGHNFLGRHNHLLNPEKYPDPICRACGEEEETSSHLILECPVLSEKRFKILGQHLFRELYEWEPRKVWQMIEAAKTFCEELSIDM